MENNYQNGQAAEQASKSKKGNARILVFFSLVFFFCPFFLVECGSVRENVLGIEFVLGPLLEDMTDHNVAVNFFALFSFFSILICLLRRKMSGLSGLWWTIGGTVSMILFPIWLSFEHEDTWNYVSIRFGYYLVIACLVIAAFLYYNAHRIELWGIPGTPDRTTPGGPSPEEKTGAADEQSPDLPAD